MGADRECAGLGALLVEIVVRVTELRGDDEPPNAADFHGSHRLFDGWYGLLCAQRESVQLPIGALTERSALCLRHPAPLLAFKVAHPSMAEAICVCYAHP